MRQLLLVGLCLASACGDRGTARVSAPPITVYAAASFARTLRALADSFQARTPGPVRAELGGSLELTRRITELGRNPDVLLVIDDGVMAALAPSHVDWYVRFATNRIVVAYTDRSAHADSITQANWFRMLSREGVSVGRADSATAPAGRQALAIIRNAQGYYENDLLTDRLLARANPAFVRPDAAQLAALLERGEVDYVLDFESVARQYGFKFVELPADLAPTVVYSVSVPRRAAARQRGVEFVSFILSDEGRQIMRDGNLTLLPVAVAVGSQVPDEIAARVRIVPATSAAPF